MGQPTSSRQRRLRSSASERERWVTRYQGSDLSAVEFARRHGLSPWTLRAWGTQVRKARRTTPPPVTEIAMDWPARSNGVSDWIAEVECPSGVVLRWKEALGVREVQALVRTLRRVC